MLSYGGGALPPQLPLYMVGAGGPMASRRQYTSWIGVDDLARAYVHVIFRDVSGPVNAVAPNPVTHGEFARTLGRVLKRPAAVSTPSFGPKLVLGREGYDQLIDTDQRVTPDKLMASGFRFAHPTLESALRHTLLKPAATAS